MLKNTITYSVALTLLLSATNAFSSGGISMIGGGDTVNTSDFSTTNIENGFSVSGQGVTVTIVNGLVTVTKNNDVVKIGDSVEISGDIETRKIESPLTGVGDSGIAASGGISMNSPSVQNAVTNIPRVEIKDSSFTGKFFRKLGVE